MPRFRPMCGAYRTCYREWLSDQDSAATFLQYSIWHISRASPSRTQGQRVRILRLWYQHTRFCFLSSAGISVLLELPLHLCLRYITLSCKSFQVRLRHSYNQTSKAQFVHVECRTVQIVSTCRSFGRKGHRELARLKLASGEPRSFRRASGSLTSSSLEVPSLNSLSCNIVYLTSHKLSFHTSMIELCALRA